MSIKESKEDQKILLFKKEDQVQFNNRWGFRGDKKIRREEIKKISIRKKNEGGEWSRWKCLVVERAKGSKGLGLKGETSRKPTMRWKGRKGGGGSGVEKNGSCVVGKGGGCQRVVWSTQWGGLRGACF